MLIQKANNTAKNHIAVRAGYISIAGNMLLAGSKYWAGMVSGSAALMADAWHTLSDSLSSIIMIAGLRLSRKPADEQHPFGHGRAELIASLAIGFLLVVVAISFFTEALHKIQSREQAFFGAVAKGVTIASILGKEAMAQYSLWAYRKTGYKSVKADGWHHRSDALSSLIILAGIFLGNYFWWMDSLLTTGVAILLLHTSYQIIRSAISPLMGARPDSKIVNRIHYLADKHLDHPAHVHHVHMHEYGDYTELTFHIKLPASMTLEDSHARADKLEKAIYEDMGIESTIHVEPE